MCFAHREWIVGSIAAMSLAFPLAGHSDVVLDRNVGLCSTSFLLVGKKETAERIFNLADIHERAASYGTLWMEQMAKVNEEGNQREFRRLTLEAQKACRALGVDTRKLLDKSVK
jgi:hypothetical protein